MHRKGRGRRGYRHGWIGRLDSEVSMVHGHARSHNDTKVGLVRGCDESYSLMAALQLVNRYRRRRMCDA